MEGEIGEFGVVHVGSGYEFMISMQCQRKNEQSGVFQLKISKSKKMNKIARSVCTRKYSSSRTSPYKYNGPSKTPSLRLQSQSIDSTTWDQIELKSDDIFVVTPGKAGTTLTTEIVNQLLSSRNASSVVHPTDKPSIWPELTSVNMDRLHIQLQN
eukprot:763529_1